jgi:DinB superfamily
MSTSTAVASELEILRHQAGMTDGVLRVNTEGVSHAESLVQPQPDGNCLNWVVGHLACIYNNALPLVGQEPVVDRTVLQRYDRGSPPLRDASEAMDLQELLGLWARVSERFQAGIAGLTPEVLDQPAPFSPSDDPNETVRSLLSTVLFHQAYHAGQTGVLRRIAGKEGAIR